MLIESHRLIDARQVECPHQDERPYGEISLVVIHAISLPPGSFGGSEVIDLFTGSLDTRQPGLEDLEGVRVSSHLYIRRDGEIIQFVPFDRRAWHAGASKFGPRDNCNDFSIGIELEGADDIPYETAQYLSLAGVCARLLREYSVTEFRGHCHIAPGRKTDPGPAFDWRRLKRLLAASFH